MRHTKTKKFTKNESLHRAILIGGSASILMTLFSPSVLAAEVKSAIDDKKKKKEAVEIIEVSGVRGSLESALLTKRSASSIVDAISAKDMDSLPALDLGEALQAIPGIQLNNDDASRNSEINLRGLGGGYVKVTAEGQSFATPSRGSGDVGDSNPFGSFEASVFDGVTVVKAPTADMQEGGIAGIVDKKLQRALGQKDGKYSIGLGSRYEELSESWDNEFKASASKHLIKDKLAFAFKIAGSEQNFRRDTVNFTQYTSLNTVNNNSIVNTQFISADDLNAYKTQHGITHPLSIVKVVGKAGQVTENQRGDRLSGTGNIEFKATDALKIGANFLYTKRDLDESNMEDVQFAINTEDRSGTLDTQKVTLIGEPIRLDDDINQNYNPEIHHPDLATYPVYAVTHAAMTNVSVTQANRLSGSKEEAKGIFLYANYVVDDWSIDGTVSKSKATNEFHNSGLDLRLQTKGKNQLSRDLDNSERYFNAPTGINGVINTGNSNLKNAWASMENYDNVNYSDVNGVLTQLDPVTGEPLYDLGENAWQRAANGWSTVPLDGFSSSLDPKINPLVESDFPAGYFTPAVEELTPEEEAALTPEQMEARTAQIAAREAELAGYTGKSVGFYVTGRVQRPEREYESGDINIERYIDLGSDSFKFTSIKFGARHSRETLETYDINVGPGGADVSILNEQSLFKDRLSSQDQAEYFNGEYPGYYGPDAGWQVLDSVNLKESLTANLMPYDVNGNLVEDFEVADATGFAGRVVGSFDPELEGLNSNYKLNFSADQAINAVYLMTNFEGQIGDITYSGNAGVRYVETTNDVIGQGFDENGHAIAVLTETDYDNTLPSLNIAIDLSEDVVLRAAYSEALVRPNLMSQTPSPAYTNTSTRVFIENSKAEVLPYTSTNYDLSLEWYNREGSAMSIGVFRKEIEGKIVSEKICPIGDHEKYNVGELEIVQNSGGECREVGEFDPGNGEDIVSNRKVIINSTYNSDIPITVTGYELAIQQKLDFLPYPYNGFGGVFNFSKVDLDDGGGIPMTHISPYSYNLIGYYENDGASIRLAYNWQDDKLLDAVAANSFLGRDIRTQTEGGRLDLSASYNLGKGLRVNLMAINLTDRQQHEYINGNEDAVSRIRYAGRTYSVSLNYNF